RGELAREGGELADRLGDEVARVRCRAMAVEYAGRHGQPADALPDALATLAQAERTGDPRALAQAHHTVAHCYDGLDCTAEALEHGQEALTGYRGAGESFGEGRILSLLASLLWGLGENGRARELYERAYQMFVDCDDPSGAGVMLSCVADLQVEDGDAVGA